MKLATIYKITSPTGKIYIGQSWDIKNRVRSHKCITEKQMITNTGSVIIRRSIKKHGWDNHKLDILHELPCDVNQQVLDGYETFYISQYKECGFILMNIREGGSRGKHKPESIAKIFSFNKGRKKSKEQIEKHRIAMTGKKQTAEHISKRVEKLNGKKRSEELRKHLSDIKKGKKLSIEHREKLKEARRGRVITDETRKKLSESTKRYCENNPDVRKIKHLKNRSWQTF